MGENKPLSDRDLEDLIDICFGDSSVERELKTVRHSLKVAQAQRDSLIRHIRKIDIDYLAAVDSNLPGKDGTLDQLKALAIEAEKYEQENSRPKD